MLKRIGLVDLLGLIILVILVFVRGTFIGDPGVGWHLRTGQWIIEHGAFPDKDPFLFTTAAKSWVANQWLADVIFWKIYDIGKWPLVHAICLGLVLAIYYLGIVPLLVRQFSAGLIPLLGLLFCMMISSIQWFLRPVMFSFLLFGIVLRITYSFFHSVGESSSLNTRAFYLLPLLFVLWANLHPGFALGLSLVAFCSVAIVLHYGRVAKAEALRALVVFFLCGAATLVNPYGAGLHRYIFGLLGNNYFMQLNMEWKSPDFQDLVFFPFALSIVFLIGGLALFRPAKGRKETDFHTFDWLLTVVFLCLALRQRRYIPFFGLAIALPITKVWFLVADFWKNWWSSLGLFRQFSQILSQALDNINRKDACGTHGEYTFAVWIIISIFTFTTGHLPGRDQAYSDFHEGVPSESAKLLQQTGGGGRIFHTPDWGGYLTWKLWPEFKAFIDDRNQLNGEAAYEEYFTAIKLKEGWRDVLERYAFKWALLYPEDPLTAALRRADEWELVLQNKHEVLFRRQHLK